MCFAFASPTQLSVTLPSKVLTHPEKEGVTKEATFPSGAVNPSNTAKPKNSRAQTATPMTTSGRKPTWTFPRHRDRAHCVILRNVGTVLLSKWELLLLQSLALSLQ